MVFGVVVAPDRGNKKVIPPLKSGRFFYASRTNFEKKLLATSFGWVWGRPAAAGPPGEGNKGIFSIFFEIVAKGWRADGGFRFPGVCPGVSQGRGFFLSFCNFFLYGLFFCPFLSL